MVYGIFVLATEVLGLSVLPVFSWQWNVAIILTAAGILSIVVMSHYSGEMNKALRQV